MTAQLHEIVAYTNHFLDVASVQDYCPNGLQVEGSSTIKKMIGGVTASQALIQAAIEKNADAILVHHGYFWKGEDQTITGLKRRRIASLLEHSISLIAYHLPLDLHPVVGNNIQLMNNLGLTYVGPLDPASKRSIGIVAELPQPLSADAFRQQISATLGRDSLHIGAPEKLIKRIGLCTGAAQGYIDQAVALNLDAYISGEISEPTFHIACETGVNYFSAGHHATERGGVRALGNHLAEKFGITFEFIDIFNPV
jgi:dinuclear metal center YbgI/SA1388 family protein